MMGMLSRPDGSTSRLRPQHRPECHASSTAVSASVPLGSGVLIARRSVKGIGVEEAWMREP